jgi:isopropylmalate/homocitrate/citramalate synthase
MQASTLDMLRLNQLFNRFLATGARPVPAPAPPATPAPPGHATASPRAETASAAAPPPAVVISDTTLRDGEQMPGVVFSPEHKREIAGRLRALGIPLIEAGYPAVSDAERQAIRQVVEDGGDALVQVIARPVDRDLDAALETGAQSIAIFIGTSTSHLNAKLRMTRDEALAAVDRAIRRAKSAGRNVVFAAEDATRTETDALLRFCVGAAEAGADALGLADTVGIATPSTMAAMVAAVADGCPLPIAVHCHNDLGLATANSLAGLAAGASGVQCSVLGIGERAGNAPLEQVVLALHAALGHDTGLDLRLLQPLADRVAQLIGHPIPPYQPVTGGNAFAHESGLHLDGITHDPLTYEPYDPALLGRSRRIVLGKHSGVSAVLAVAHAAGLDLDPERARDLLTEIKNAAGHERPAVPVEASEIVLRLMEAGR